MSARPFPYITTGVDSIKAATALRDAQARRDQWPYWWEFAPPNSTGKRVLDSRAVAVAGTPAAIVTFQVPAAMKFILTGVIIDYDGGGWVQGRGDALFSITCNAPPALTTPQGFAVDGFNEIPLLVGNFRAGVPFDLGKAEIFKAQDIIRIVGTNVTLADGSPNFWLGALVGWIMPE